MNSTYNPPRIYTDVMKLKYRMLAPSIAIIIGSFIANFYIETSMLRWLAATSLVVYFVFFTTYRLRRLAPPDEKNAMLAPICGKVVSVEEHPTETVILIRKGIFVPADVRSALDGERPADALTVRSESGDASWMCSKNLRILDSRPGLKGRLIGAMPYDGRCKVTVSKAWSVEVRKGAAVSAGETVLARLQTESTDNE